MIYFIVRKKEKIALGQFRMHHDRSIGRMRDPQQQQQQQCKTQTIKQHSAQYNNVSADARDTQQIVQLKN